MGTTRNTSDSSGRPLVALIVAAAFLMPTAAWAEFYLYRGPNGEKMVSDRPMPGYSLLTRRDTVKDAGHILANRPISPGGPARFQSYIRSASDRYGVDVALVEAVIAVESGFDPNAVSKRGATGLMQLMSDTARQYEVQDRFDPRQNINGGVKHLRYLLDRFDGQLSLVLAAYNAGAGAVDQHRGIPPFAETRRYVRKVLDLHTRYRALRYGS